MKKTLIIILIVAAVLIVFIAGLVIVFKKMPKFPMRGKVAIVYVEGAIFDSKEIVDEIKRYTKDKAIKAIVLRVDSPGGGVAPSQEIYEEVKKAVEEKSVVVSMGSVAASGGYYVSAPADLIVANPGTLTGSIGAIMEIPNVEGLMDKIGVKTETIKSGKNKDMASIFRKMGSEQKLILQTALDDIHNQFIEAVSEGRNMPIKDVRKLADGRIFTGRQALKAGLVDELGTFEDAIYAAADLAGIKGEPQVVGRIKRTSIFDILKGKFPKDIMDVFPSIKVNYMFAP
jgi:protease-4